MNMAELPREVPSYEKFVFAPRNSKYCVAVFVINENGRIRAQLERMQPFAPSVDIVIADGGSTDGSLEHGFLKQKRVRALLVKTGPGKLSAQMRMAFDFALDEGYEGIIVMDGNNKDNPDAIPRFVKALDEGVEHVQGSRFIKGGKHENTPLERLIAIRLIHAPLISLAARHWYTDTTNGFRAYSRKFLLDPRVAPLRNAFSAYQLHYYLSIRAGELGYRIAEIPVERIYPSGDVPTKIKSWKEKLDLFGELIEACRKRYNPPS